MTTGPNAGQSVSLEHAPIVIGRGADAQIILDDDYVSTRHARVAVSGDQWFVEDLGSTNGTFLESTRVDSPLPIPPGARVKVGTSVLELQG